MRKILRRASALAGAFLLAAPPVDGQSVADIVEQMYQAYESQAAGVENYTLVQTMMGFETVTYFEKEFVDGRPIFRMSDSYAGGFNMSLGDDDVGHGDVFMFGPDLVEHGRYAGRERVEGNATHVLVIDDLSALEIAGPSGPDDMDFVPKSGRMYIDAEILVPRRMEFDGEVTTDEGVQEVTMQMNLRDYRDIEGLLIPHSTVMQIDGIQAMMDPEMQGQMEEMRRQLENMPEEQRAMMERMMAGQMERLEEMMGGGGGPMTVEVTVTDVRVNAGPPGD